MPHSWLLEDRICLCGCGQKFRCLPTSKARYASFLHTEDATDLILRQKTMAERKEKAEVLTYFRRAYGDLKELDDKIRQLEENFR